MLTHILQPSLISGQSFNLSEKRLMVFYYLIIIWQKLWLNCINREGERGYDTITVHPSLSSKQTEYSNINKQKHIKAKWFPLQYSAGFFVLERIVWGGDAHKERVVSGMFTAVVHKVRRGLWYLYPLNAGLYSQLLHRSLGLGDVIGAVRLRWHPWQFNTGRAGYVQSGLAVSPST